MVREQFRKEMEATNMSLLTELAVAAIVVRSSGHESAPTNVKSSRLTSADTAQDFRSRFSTENLGLLKFVVSGRESALSVGDF